NGKRQLVAVQLLVTSRDDIAIIQGPTSNPFTLPVSRIADLMSYSSVDQLWKRVHVRGVATWVRPGHGLCIQDETGAVEMRSWQDSAVEPGDRLDVIGFISRGGYSPLLEDGTFQKLGGKGEITPRHVTPSEAPFGRYDAELISIDALLLEASEGLKER